MVEDTTAWQPDASLRLKDGEIHVWRTAVDAHFGEMEALRGLLCPDEQARAARFRYRIHRLRWIVARAVLRRILAHYLDTDPSELHFAVGPHGKPELTPTCNPAGIHFNISHSGNLALYAVGTVAVGIDVERVKPTTDIVSLARRWFTPGENRGLNQLPLRLRPDGFYAAWTRKEAYFKARGYGLSHGVDHVEVSVDPRTPARLLAAVDDPAVPARWSLVDIRVDAPYRAALVVDGQGQKLVLRDYVDRTARP